MNWKWLGVCLLVNAVGVEAWGRMERHASTVGFLVRSVLDRHPSPEAVTTVVFLFFPGLLVFGFYDFITHCIPDESKAILLERMRADVQGDLDSALTQEFAARRELAEQKLEHTLEGL